MSDDHWNLLTRALSEKTLLQYMQQLSMEEILRRDEASRNLLMITCEWDDNMDAFFKLLTLFNVNDVDINDYNAAHFAAPCSARKLEILCAVGVNIQKKTRQNKLSPLDRAIIHVRNKTARVLIANGSRMRNISNDLSQFLMLPQLIKFEKAVISCRDAIIILLGLKKRRVILPNLDRLLIRQELAVAIWTTRTKDNWQLIDNE